MFNSSGAPLVRISSYSQSPLSEGESSSSAPSTLYASAINSRPRRIDVSRANRLSPKRRPRNFDLIIGVAARKCSCILIFLARTSGPNRAALGHQSNIVPSTSRISGVHSPEYQLHFGRPAYAAVHHPGISTRYLVFREQAGGHSLPHLFLSSRHRDITARLAPSASTTLTPLGPPQYHLSLLQRYVKRRNSTGMRRGHWINIRN
ncbi:hypothetical protein B0H13DRAFT_1922965 [Mycena leptocephala]|nr:hypothetical protein B0H13DRAFT_1922965 [Mycena leptocephala]